MSDLPENWTSTQLGEVCKVVRGITFPASAKEEKPTPNNVCCLRTANVQKEVDWDDVYFVSKEYVKRDDQFVKIGDILMSMANSYELVGKVSVVRELPYLTSFGAFISAVRPTPVIEAQYLFHLLRTAKVQSELRKGSSQTVNIANISVGRLSEIEVPLAPLDEQKRIAEKLDSLLTRVDSCKSHLERVPQILKRFRQSVLAAAIEGKLEIQNDEFGIGQGQLPEGWRWIDFKEIMQSLKNGFFYGRPAIEPPGIPILRISAVRPMSVNLDEPRFVPDIDEDKVKGYFLEKGDLLFTRYNGNAELVGACGRVRELPKPTIYPDKLIRVKVNYDIVLPEYLEMYFATQTARKFIEGRIKSTAGQHGIAGGDIKSIPVILPPIEEQAEIVRRVESLFAYAERLEARYLSASERVARLTPSLLAKGFRGELVEQEQG